MGLVSSSSGEGLLLWLGLPLVGSTHGSSFLFLHHLLSSCHPDSLSSENMSMCETVEALV